MITKHIKKKTKKFVRKTKGGKPYVKASQEYLQPEKVANNKYCESCKKECGVKDGDCHTSFICKKSCPCDRKKNRSRLKSSSIYMTGYCEKCLECETDVAEIDSGEESEPAPASAPLPTVDKFMEMGLSKEVAEVMIATMEEKKKEETDAKTYEELKVKHGIVGIEEEIEAKRKEIEFLETKKAKILEHDDFKALAPKTTAIRKPTAGELSDGMKSFIRRLEVRAPLGKVNAHTQGHKCLSCAKFYIGRDTSAWKKHKARCQDVKKHKLEWVKCVRENADTMELRLKWRPS